MDEAKLLEKLRLIEAGVFGRVYVSFNDFAGHGYHGISVMRSYLGFDARPVQVTGAVRQYPLAAHWSRIGDHHDPRDETQEHVAPARRPEHGVVAAGRRRRAPGRRQSRRKTAALDLAVAEPLAVTRARRADVGERDLLVDFDMRSDISGSFFAAFFFYRGFGQRSMGFIFNGQSGLAKQAHYGTA